MLAQRWTRDAVLARMAAETAIDTARSVSDHDRATARLAVEKIRLGVESGTVTAQSAALEFDTVRRSLAAAA